MKKILPALLFALYCWKNDSRIQHFVNPVIECNISKLQGSFIFFLQGILDIDPTKFQSERHKYICQIPNCSESFSKDQDLIFHIGETHHILHESIFNGIHFPKNRYAKKLEMTDYLPKPYNRDGNEIRYVVSSRFKMKIID